MLSQILRHCLLAAGASLALTTAALAANLDQPPGPPPEAVAACKGKAEGVQVSFTARNGETLTGTCQSVNGTLAAMPAGGPPRPPSR